MRQNPTFFGKCVKKLCTIVDNSPNKGVNNGQITLKIGQKGGFGTVKKALQKGSYPPNHNHARKITLLCAARATDHAIVAELSASFGN